MNAGNLIRYRRSALATLKIFPTFMLLSACNTLDLNHSGSLSSYFSLKRSDGMSTRSEFFVDSIKVDSAKTVRIMPTLYAQSTTGDGLDVSQREVLTNMVDRSLCQGLSARLQIVKPDEPADLVVRAVVTQVQPTDVGMAGVSKVIGVVPALLSAGVPVPVPRIPVGLGSLSVEAEAIDRRRVQAAAMVWARQADVVSSRARLSKVGDAYDLAGAFGEDFSKLVVTGSDPMTDGMSMPSMTAVMTTIGMDPNGNKCRMFGENPGLKGLIGSGIGLPPEWLDKGRS